MARLAYVDYGTDSDSEPLVFLGSIGSTTDMWLPQLDALSQSRRVIALDHRGHGASQVIPGACTIADLAHDVVETLDELGVEKFGVIGLSLGGAVAQYLAATSDRVTRAAFLCTAAKFGEPQGWHDRAKATRENGVASLADAIIGRWFSPGFINEHPATTDAHRRMISSTSDEGYAACCEALAGWDFAEHLHEISVPVLTIAGADDPATPPATVQVIADRVSGPVQAVVLTPGAHVPTIERPTEVTEALRAHFA